MPTLSLGGQTLATQTGSDAPVLGSVTLNSNQSFPAGHAIQMQHAIYNGTATVSITSVSASPTTGPFYPTSLNSSNLKVGITPKFANSLLFVHAVIRFGPESNNIFGPSLRRHLSGESTYLMSTASNTGASNYGTGMVHDSGVTVNSSALSVGINWVDSAQSNSVEHIYEIVFSADVSNKGIIWNRRWCCDDSRGESRIVVTEFKQ